MGYYIDLHAADFEIKADKKVAALAAVKEIDPTGIAWVTSREFHDAKTIEEMLAVWGYRVEVNEVGDIVDLECDNEKLGDEETLFDAIAPFVTNGSYVEIIGEDGDRWRWVFDGESMRTSTPTLVWS